MSRRALFSVALPFALHGLAREVDAAVGVLLHTTLDLPGFVGEALALVDPWAAAGAAARWTAAGVAAWILLAAWRARREGDRFGPALEAESDGFAPLCLRPLITLLALVSLAVRPTWPYGFTLPVALTQDWGPAQDLAALAALVAARARPLRLPAPGAVSVGFLAFLAYALLTPSWARHWDGHPGNEPKTLRMAVALGHWLSLDVEPVSAPMEELPARPWAVSAAAAVRATARESVEMARALARGPAAVGASAIRATPVTRQTLRGKDGGTYYVLAPGPSVLLAPLLRADRALNLRRGTPGRLTVSLLAWNALAGALVAALFLLMRDATGQPGLAALGAGTAALLPPALFYAYQFYPEMLGAAAMALALRALLFIRWWSARTCLWLGLLLAVLPWLHQKFLPLWAALVVAAVVRAVGDLVTARALVALLVPQAVSLYLVALYNFAITGSVRPDAMFLAWGFGVSTARIELGLLGLPFDARYGLLPYVPAFLLAAGGVAMGGPAAARLRWGLVAPAVYFLTVAAADNWAGPVSNLGRFLLPLVPVLAVLAAVSLARTGGRPGVAAVALTLAGWSALIGVALWRDPHAANDCALLLAKSDYADGNVYIPNLFLRSWDEAAPGTFARVAVWLGLAVVLAVWLKRAEAWRVGARAAGALAGLAATLVLAALALERWPHSARGARPGQAVELGAGATAFVAGAAEVSGDHVRARAGTIEMLVRSRRPLTALEVQVEGAGVLLVPGRPAVPLPGHTVAVELPLTPLRRLTGRRGVEETLYRQRLEVDRTREVVLHLRARE